MNKSHKGDKSVRLSQILPIIEEKLKMGGKVTFGPHGRSMRPLIREGRDSVTVALPTRELKVGDIAFYKMPDGQFVLHRIVRKRNGEYVTRGDNMMTSEQGVKESWVIGIVVSLLRDGKTVSCQSPGYILYCMAVLPLWRIWVRLKNILGKIKVKIKKIFG